MCKIAKILLTSFMDAPKECWMDSAFGGCKCGRCGRTPSSQSPAAAVELITRRDPFQPFHTDGGRWNGKLICDGVGEVRTCRLGLWLCALGAASSGCSMMLWIHSTSQISQCQVRKKGMEGKDHCTGDMKQKMMPSHWGQKKYGRADDLAGLAYPFRVTTYNTLRERSGPRSS